MFKISHILYSTVTFASDVLLFAEIQSFSSRENLLKAFTTVNQTVIAIIFNSNDTKHLDYDIRFYDQYVRGETNDLYLSELQYSNYGKNKLNKIS